MVSFSMVYQQFKIAEDILICLGITFAKYFQNWLTLIRFVQNFYDNMEGTSRCALAIFIDPAQHSA